MLRRLAREESGMTMGLVVIMVVLIGVMGAGLLTFVTTDLNAVIKVNQGQKAFEMADAGVEAAKAQLLDQPNPLRYDGVDGGSAQTDVRWSFDGDRDGSRYDPQDGIALLDLNGNGGTDDQARVTIESSTVAGSGVNAGSFDTGDRNCRGGYTAPASSQPAVNAFLSGTTTYRVVSTGEYGDAKRRVEAVLQRGSASAGYMGFPMATFSTGTVELGSGVEISCMSVFSLGGMASTNVRESDPPTLDGGDIYFGNWYNPPWNGLARNIVTNNTGTNKTRETEAGFGFLGQMMYAAPSDSTTRVITRRIDYSDVRSDENDRSTPRLSNNTWAQDADPLTVQPTIGGGARIGFPFDTRVERQQDLTNAVDYSGDSGPNDSLEAEARRQGKFFEPGSSDFEFNSAARYALLNSPDDVVYIRYPPASGKVVKYVTGTTGTTFLNCGDRFGPGIYPCPTGTLVIENAKFDGSTDLGHEGVIIVRGNAGTQPVYQVGSEFDVKGFVNVQGNMTMGTRSRIFPIPPDQLGNYYPFLGTFGSGAGSAANPSLRSWRECDEGTLGAC